MECPKCGGGSYLAEEELVKVVESPDPVKIIIKSVYQCRACSERFSRLFYDLLDSRKRPEHHCQQQYQQAQYQQPVQKQDTEPAEGLKFF